MKIVGSAWRFLRDTYTEFSSDNASLFGAALAYYAFFSLAPLLLVAIAIAGVVFGTDAARSEVVAQTRYVFGSEGAEAIQSLLTEVGRSREGLTVSLVGFATLALGATRVFTNLQTALNIMWGVPDDEEVSGIGARVRRTIKKRALSFAMVLGVGCLLLASLVASTTLSALGGHLAFMAPTPGDLALYRISDVAGSFLLVTFLLAAVYRFLPDAVVEWRDVWLGSVSTALLLTVGKFVIGWYLGSRSLASAFGAAGSLVVILLWVYYSAQIVLFGAEMTQVFAARFGSRKGRGGAGGSESR